MAFIKTPVKGMNDFLPREMALRQEVLHKIRTTYRSFGFSEIETPCMEHIENLTGKQGGENEKLIFKVLKRGAALSRALEKGDDLADSGMRYDLTLPLSRFYAANSASLTAPFKALQIGSVWRADQPQKGRFRQFTQCDIDILGDASPLAEIELVSATAGMLSVLLEKTNLSGFTIHVNDRRILKAMASACGFEDEVMESVFIALDKLDKIGIEGVKKELEELGLLKEGIEKYLSFFEDEITSVSEFCAALPEGVLEQGVAEGLETILSCVEKSLPPMAKLKFDPTLVRGMGYYTGTIFEVKLDEYSFSIAGGGRYDEMIGKFSGQKTPACGFSIGFERIITILKDQAMDQAESLGGIALLVENGADANKMTEVFEKAARLRKEGKTVTVLPLKKNAKFQIDRLMEEGYTEIERIYRS